MTFHTRLTAASLALLVGGMLLTGCTTTDSETAPSAPAEGEKIATSLTALIEQELASEDLSGFEREVYERAADTGEIASADYEEAFSRYTQCVQEGGYDETATKLANGLYQVSLELPDGGDAQEYYDAYNAVAEDCAKGTIASIEALYRLQQGNDELLSNPYEVAVLCLQEAGLAPGDYTASDLEVEFSDGFEGVPFDVNDSQAQLCFSNAGLAVAVAG
ncbi:MAG: hypothetical protein QM677_01920 [Microbacterium sp.]